MATSDKNLFRLLTKLFRSGPVVKRKVRTLDTTTATPNRGKSSGLLLFQRTSTPTYANITSNAYNLAERLMRYQDYQEMEFTPEIAAALDIYADEACSQDEKGRILHVNSDNEKIKEELEELFYNTLNVEFNLRSWTRNVVKYGDFFLYNDVSPEHGVLNVFPIPVNEIEREDNYDPNDPFAVRYRWNSLGNRTLENWEVTHFRLLGNDMFIPYGASVVEPARRIWRQLILAEDAMLVYRVTRAPERRVFKIDVGNVPAEEVELYMEEQRKNLRTNQVVDPTTGRVDLRYNPFSVDEDYFLPVRGKESGTAIDTLAGGQNTAAIEDVAYLQKKLFAALKVPRAYLGYDEALGSKATLAQEDIRFSRTTNVIQKTMIAEMNKVAIIHLFACGYRGDDLLNFNLRLSNPSTVSQQQKLELWRTRFEIAGTAPEGMASKNFVRREIWGLNEEQCKKLDDERYTEKVIDATLEGLTIGGAGVGEAGGEAPPGGADDLGGLGDDPAGEEPEDPAASGEEPPEENAGEEPEEDERDIELLTSSDDLDLPEVELKLDKNKLPVKVGQQLDKALYNRSRHRTHGAAKTHMPDFGRMVSNDTKSTSDPYDQQYLKSIATNPFGEAAEAKPIKIRLPPDVVSTLYRMKEALNLGGEALATSQAVIAEHKSMSDGNDNSEDSGLFIVDEDEENDSDE